MQRVGEQLGRKPARIAAWFPILVSLALAGCGTANPTAGPVSAVPKSTVIAAPTGAGATAALASPNATIPPPILDPPPSNPTPPSLLANFLINTRVATIGFFVSAHGSYTIGSTKLSYNETATVNGANRTVQIIELTGSRAYQSTITYAGGLLYTRGDAAQPWNVDASPTAVRFGSAQFQLQHTLVLGDLGSTEAIGAAAYRLRVASGVDLFPPQFVDGTIGSPHNQQQRLEFLIDGTGTLVSAHEARSIDGTIDGVAGTASGTMDYTFSNFGSPLNVAVPALPGGQTLPTPQPAATPIAEDWMSPPAGNRGFTVHFPEPPVESLSTIHSARANADLALQTRLLTYPSGLRFYEQDAAYPKPYLAAHSVADQLSASELGGAADVGGQLVGSLSITVDGLPAVAYVIATPTTIYRVEAFFVRDRLVILSVVGALDEVTSGTADQFLSSVLLAH